MRETPKPFEVYRHFKGNKYQILTIATDSETGKPCVVYQAMYGDYMVYVRDMEMFLSETDTVKYPDAGQKFRFEKVQPGERETEMSKPEPAIETVNLQPDVMPQISVQSQPDTEQEIDPAVMEYLEAETVDARLNILASLHHRITDAMINTMAVVTDVEINEGPVEQRYQELKNCLLMKQKFEKQRY